MENVKNKIDLLTKRILTIECVILKQIVRNNNENVNKIKDYLLNEIYKLNQNNKINKMKKEIEIKIA